MSASVASIVDFGLAIGLNLTGVLTYGYANIIGVISGGLTNFTLNCRFVFSQTGRRTRYLALRYLTVWLGSMLLNGGGTNLITYIVGAKYFVVVKSVVALCVAFCFNYPLQRTFVFRKKTPAVNGGEIASNECPEGEVITPEGNVQSKY